MNVDVAIVRRGLMGPALGFAAGLGVLCGAAPLYAYPLDQASMQADENGVVLRLEAAGQSGQLPYEVFCLDDPFRVVVDVYGADAPAALAEQSSTLIQDVRSSVWKDGPDGRVVRYVIETCGPMDYEAKSTTGAIEIVMQPRDEASQPNLAQSGSAALSVAGTLPEGPTHEASTPEATETASAPMATTVSEARTETTSSAAPTHSAAGHESTNNGEVQALEIPVPPASSNGEPDAYSFPPSTEMPTNLVHALVQSHTPAGRGASTMVPDGGPAGTYSTSNAIEAEDASLPPAIASRLHRPYEQRQDTAPRMGMADPTTELPPDDAGAASGRTMNLDVQNADVQTVFRSIAAYGGVNIVPDRDVTGPISIKVTDLPWRQALEVVCQAAGLVAVESNGVIRVATLRTYGAEQLEIESSARKREEFLPLETHVFVVGYAFAGELSNTVQLILSERGTVNFDSRTNSLVVTDIPPRIEEVGRLISELDTETLQVEITAKLVDADATATRRLGILWNVDNIGDVGEGTSLSGAVTEGLQDASGTLQFGLVKSWGNLDATLQALEQSNDAHIISNPKITTINNSPASILVGKEIPLITLDEAGNPVTELKKVGITLRVTPFINADRRITMELHPEISDLSSQATVQGGIIFIKSEAETRVMVEDGQTAVIGGLIRTNETRFERGVPILKSIPFLGALFRTTDTVRESRELLIFVTPRIVGDVASR